MATYEGRKCDVTGTKKSVENVTFSLAGKDYEVDLCSEQATMLTDALAPFVKVAREVETTIRKKRAPNGSAAPKKDWAPLRAWAAKKKIALPAQGRIPHAIVQQFEAATAGGE